jgi:peptide/nickel transport system ATP-binding protein
MSLLQVDRASVRYAESARRVEAVREASFTIARGERVGLVGPSGCGKSSLMRAMLGLEPLSAGTITFDGQPVHGAAKALRARFQPVLQDSLGALDPRLTVAQLLGEPLWLHRRPRGAGVISALLEQVRLPSALAAHRPSELSAGQRQRVNLARALALEPELLLLDEPVSALDVSAQAQIIALLEQLAEQRLLTMVFVSHDVAIVEHLCSRVLTMAEGRVEERS